MTALDDALQQAQRPDGIDSSFYTAFLSSILYIPTHDAAPETDDQRASEDQSVSPIIIDGGDVQVIMLFDSPERLEAWAEEETHYAGVPGHVIAEIFPSSYHWFLNYGTDHGKEFTSEEIEWIKENLAAMNTDEATMPAGTNVIIGQPESVPSGLFDALKSSCETNAEVAVSAFGQVFIEGVTENPGFGIALAIDSESEDVSAAIRRDVSVAVNSFVPEGTELFLFDAREEGVGTALLESGETVYTRKAG